MCIRDSTLTLSPSHGKHVYALVVITGVHGNTLYAENVETLQRDEKDQLAKAIRQEMTLVTRLLQKKSSPKEVQWDEKTSPIASSKCRLLCRSPTGPELDAMNIRAPKKARTD